MATLEDQLSRYGAVLDASVDPAGVAGDRPVELVAAARHRRGTRPALAAAAVVVVVALIAVVAGTRSAHEPAPTTNPIVSPTTTIGTTTTNPQLAAAVAAQQRASAEAWILAHHGRVVDLHAAAELAMSDRAVYAWSYGKAGDATETVSRVDRTTLHIVSVKVPQGTGWLSVGGNTVYLLTTRTDHDGMQVTRLDPDTLRVLWTAPLADATAIDDASQIAGNAKWVWVSSGHDIEQLDAQSGARLRSVNLTLPTSRAQIYLALDPSGQWLYVAYGDGSGAPQPLQKREAATGEISPLAPTGNTTAAGGFTAPQLVATADGVWLTGQTPASRGKTVASFYRTNGLGKEATLTAGADTGRRGLTLAVAGTTLWNWNSTFVACADASTGHAPSTNAIDGGTVDWLAADSTSVAVSVNGTLGIFTPRDLCPALP